MFHKGQTVTVPLNGKSITGRIIRKQGATGYIVRIPWGSSHQDFTTGKVTTVSGSKDAHWKTADIQAFQDAAPNPV